MSSAVITAQPVDLQRPEVGVSTSGAERPSARAHALALRLERGVRALADLAAGLTGEQWVTRLPGDGRKVGVVVHHVASMYPLEINLAEVLAGGMPITGVAWPGVHEINARHAVEFDAVEPRVALDLLEANGAAAAAAIRRLSDAQLDRAASISLYDDAPLTCQFMLEDHAVRHAYHHLAGIRRALAL